ncbi:hypothetical protein [Microbispora sp. NPDC049633]|uniref:hypothetical protein n=1 Tax=Microbispora sp. NPDC049633 TaxID=3154355 RepID=UPI00342ADB11
MSSWPHSGDGSQWPQGHVPAGTGDTIDPTTWPAPPSGEPAAPGAFGASPSPYDTGPQGQMGTGQIGAGHTGPGEPYDGSPGQPWQDPAGSAWPHHGGTPTAPVLYGPDQENAVGPQSAQPGETAPGVPSFHEWGPAPVAGQPSAGQPSAGEAWSPAQTPHQGYPSADPSQAPLAPGPQPPDAQGAAFPDQVRPGEPGDVPVWPPRLPGEPYPQGELPAGTSWPPVHAYQDEHGAAQASADPSGGTSGDAPGHTSAPGHTNTPDLDGTPADVPHHAGAPAGSAPGEGPGGTGDSAGQPLPGGASGDDPTRHPDAGGDPNPYARPGEEPLAAPTEWSAGEPSATGVPGPGDPTRDVPGQSVPPPGAPAPYPPSPGPAGPPAGFGTEIAHAVTPAEGFQAPGAPHEPDRPPAYPEPSTAHGGPQPASPDRTTQPLLPPPHPHTPSAPSQAQDSAPSGTPLGTQDETPADAASQAPSEASSTGVPPFAVPPGAASSDTPPTGPSASDGADGADSPNPTSGQMATTSPTTGSPSQPTDDTPFAFTPVTPAKAGKPAPPPGFGPDPSSPQGNLPATLGSPGAPPSGGKVKRILMAAGAVVVVGAIGTAAYFAYSGEPGGDQAARTPAATTAPPSDEPQPSSTVASAILDSEQTDPKTLKSEEAFPDEKVTLAGRTYRRVKVDVTDDCGKAAAGAFAQALTEQQCRRVLRATYVDGKRQYAVTTGIAVLPGKTEALAVDQTKNLGTNVWFRGLDGDKKSRADKVSISGGYAAGMVWGRYIVFSYATYADGHTPETGDTNLGPISGAFRDNTAKVIEKRASR